MMKLLLILLLPLSAIAQRIEAESYTLKSNVTDVTSTEGKAVRFAVKSGFIELKAEPGEYEVQARYSAEYYATAGDINGAAITFAPTWSFNVYRTTVIKVAVPASGIIRVTAINNNFQLNWLELRRLTPLPPVANGGPDLIINFPVDTVKLIGVPANGIGVWRNIFFSGSNGLIYGLRDTAIARNLYKSDYYFEYAVTAPSGQVARDTVRVKAYWLSTGTFSGPWTGGVFGSIEVDNSGALRTVPWVYDSLMQGTLPRQDGKVKLKEY